MTCLVSLSGAKTPAYSLGVALRRRITSLRRSTTMRYETWDMSHGTRRQHAIALAAELTGSGDGVPLQRRLIEG
jgi:hypothetical protein